MHSWHMALTINFWLPTFYSANNTYSESLNTAPNSSSDKFSRKSVLRFDAFLASFGNLLSLAMTSEYVYLLDVLIFYKN